MKIAFVIYRKWAFEIFRKISKYIDVDMIVTTKEHEFSIVDAKKYTKVYLIDGNDDNIMHQILKENEIDVVLFYGWSWIVKNKVIDDFLCLCLHPSPLPRYRGGSPIQHQIINREKKSAVTVFKMGHGIDDGDIFMQLPMSISGNIKDIFKRMTNLGIKITKKFIKDYKKSNVKFIPQKGLVADIIFKRRKPEDSEIKIEKLKEMTFEDVYNLVRGLLDPFPNVYISFDGKKINILKVKKIRGVKNTGNIINSKEGILLRLKDCFAKIVDYKISKI